MIVSLKDGLKFISVAVVAFCAVLVCSLFVNYAIDLAALDQTGFSPAQISMYKAQMANSKVVCGASGGSLTLMAVVTLLFYVKRYIDTHARELGILKALGWSDFKIARSFAVFGLCVFVGCALGYGVSWSLMPALYNQNASEMFPEVSNALSYRRAPDYGNFARDIVFLNRLLKRLFNAARARYADYARQSARNQVQGGQG